jgi:hypothetical protein
VIFVVLSLLPAAVPVAPAPLPPRPGRAAEAVLDAGTAERARLAVLYLRSDDFAASDRVPNPLAHLDSAEGRGWLRERLSVTVDGRLVRVRISGESASLSVLRAIVERLTELPSEYEGRDRQGKPRRRKVDPKTHRQQCEALKEEYRRRFQQMKGMNEKQPGRIPEQWLKQAEAQVARYEFEADPMRVREGARLLRRR